MSAFTKLAQYDPEETQPENDPLQKNKYFSLHIDARSWSETPQYVITVDAKFESSLWLVLNPHFAAEKRYQDLPTLSTYSSQPRLVLYKSV